MLKNSKYKCLNCNYDSLKVNSNNWKCTNCNHIYTCVDNIPKLLLEDSIGREDKRLRDYFYNGLLGKSYQFLMPFLTLPARPFFKSIRDWIFYFLTLIVIAGIIYASISFFLFNFIPIVIGVISIFLLVLFLTLFLKHPYLFHLLVLAIPVKISLYFSNYKSNNSFIDVHKNLIDSLLESKTEKLQVLDISTGTGNSLFRHGWMNLNADYTGLDLSETMLLQCRKFFRKQNIPLDLIVGDATNLPFVDNYFDVVLNYGAINGYSNIERALEEMTRVVKNDGIVLFLDEQLYKQATFIEKFYFRHVLSSHNIIHHCPLEFIPSQIKNVDVYQVYEFYYVCIFKSN